MPLNKDQLASLREAWAQQSQRMAQGHVPILSGNLKFQPMGLTSQDAQLMEAQRFSVEQIAMCYGVPLPVIGDLSNSTLANAETLVSLWLSISLGSLLENVEQSLTKTFELSANENINFDVAGLLRTDFLTRIDGLTRAVQGGLFSPNEARAREGLHPVPDGDRVIVQQQMVPLGFNESSDVEVIAPPVNEERSVVELSDFKKWLNNG
jgi:HK97 family phage portal protein